MRVVHLSTSDSGGGAFRAAYRLHTGLRRLGHDSKMLVLKRGSSDENSVALKPRQDLISRWQRKIRARKIWRDYEQYRPTIPPGVEPFSDDRTPYTELVDQIPPCDVINLHWVGGLLDWLSCSKSILHSIPLVWRLAESGAFTGGCHYDQGCGKFAASCGACPQLGSHDQNDLSRDVWRRKQDAVARLA